MKSTERFSNRVADYARCRPGYPAALGDWLVRHCGLKPGDAAADIGCGTGLFTRELLRRGLRVHGVEPNGPMREAGAQALAEFGAAFSAHDGSGEATGLPDACVRLACAAQAFHWFDPVAARREFARILVPGGHAALIWNVRGEDSPFLRGYDALLQKHAPEYAKSGIPAQANLDTITPFFAPAGFEQRNFDYAQHFDYDGLRGRLLSSSYAPAAGTPGHEPMLDDLRKLFDEHQHDGLVEFAYQTRAFVGVLR